MTGRKRTCTQPRCKNETIARRLCRAHYQAAWKSGDLARHETTPRRQRDRKVCPPDHKHSGSTTCYIQHQCRCDTCTDHHAEMSRRRAKLKAYGRFDTGLVDAEPVREHMLMLGEYGLGYKRVAELAGVGVTAARNVLWGRQEPGPRYGELPKRIKRENAERILSVKPDIDALADGALVPSRGTHRRAQALVALGYSQSEIARRVGVEVANFGGMLKRSRVEVRTHRAMARVFEELCMSTPPQRTHRERIVYSRSVAYAKARRWLPPLAWDDIDNDPTPAPVEAVGGVDEIAVSLALRGDPVRLSPVERREAVRRAWELRWSDTYTAERLHCEARTVLRIRDELGLEAHAFGDLVKRGAA